MPKKSKEEQKKEKVKAQFIGDRVITECSEQAKEFHESSCFGKPLATNKLQLSLVEALYIMEKGRLEILDGRNKAIDINKYVKKAEKLEPGFWTRYIVFKDMRNRGYIVKTALKFGADFRVYDRGVKPGEDHARWIIYPVKEGTTLTWHEFSAKNRVAHSTKKRLLVGVVDEENDCTYWEIRWIRP